MTVLAVIAVLVGLGSLFAIRNTLEAILRDVAATRRLAEARELREQRIFGVGDVPDNVHTEENRP